MIFMAQARGLVSLPNARSQWLISPIMGNDDGSGYSRSGPNALVQATVVTRSRLLRNSP